VPLPAPGPDCEPSRNARFEPDDFAGLNSRAAKRKIFVQPVSQPGEIIRLEARITGRLGNLVQAQATAHVAGEIVLKAELT